MTDPTTGSLIALWLKSSPKNVLLRDCPSNRPDNRDYKNWSVYCKSLKLGFPLSPTAFSHLPQPTPVFYGLIQFNP